MTEIKNSEYPNALAVAQAYIAATYEGNVSALRKLFHPSAVMNGYLDGQLVIGGPEPFFDQMASMPSLKTSGASYEANISAVEEAGNVGTVTIVETGFGPKSFTNYLSLIKENDEWQIISKTFTGE